MISSYLASPFSPLRVIKILCSFLNAFFLKKTSIFTLYQTHLLRTIFPLLIAIFIKYYHTILVMLWQISSEVFFTCECFSYPDI